MSRRLEKISVGTPRRVDTAELWSRFEQDFKSFVSKYVRDPGLVPLLRTAVSLAFLKVKAGRAQEVDIPFERLKELGVDKNLVENLKSLVLNFLKRQGLI